MLLPQVAASSPWAVLPLPLLQVSNSNSTTSLPCPSLAQPCDLSHQINPAQPHVNTNFTLDGNRGREEEEEEEQQEEDKYEWEEEDKGEQDKQEDKHELLDEEDICVGRPCPKFMMFSSFFSSPH